MNPYLPYFDTFSHFDYELAELMVTVATNSNFFQVLFLRRNYWVLMPTHAALVN